MNNYKNKNRAFILLLVFATFALVVNSAGAKLKKFDVNSEYVGLMSIGMPSDVVVKYLGKPEKTTAAVMEAATGYYVTQWKYPKRGVYLKMGAETKDGMMKVQSIRIVKPCRLTTRKGVGVGDSYEAAKKAYSHYIIDRDHNSKKMLVVGTVYEGLFFSFKKGRVSQIFLGQGAE